MQAIITKYLGPTDTRGSRIKATADSGSVTVGYNHALDTDANHRAAAEALLARLEWTGDLVQGALPNGTGYAFVFTS